MGQLRWEWGKAGGPAAGAQALPPHLPGGGCSSVRSVRSMPRTFRSISSSLSTGRSALLPAGRGSSGGGIDIVSRDTRQLC